MLTSINQYDNDNDNNDNNDNNSVNANNTNDINCNGDGNGNINNHHDKYNTDNNFNNNENENVNGMYFPRPLPRGPTLRSFQTAQMAAESALGRRGSMIQECACCIVLHSKARATLVLHYAVASCHRFMHRQGDVIRIQHASRACPAKAHDIRSLGVRALSSAYPLSPSRAQAISSS